MQNLPACSLRKILLLITAVFRVDYRFGGTEHLQDLEHPWGGFVYLDHLAIVITKQRVRRRVPGVEPGYVVFEIRVRL